MITADGWFDWAERVPGHWEKQNGGTNPVQGIFLHSAEGYETYLRSNPPLPKAIGGEKSWHLTNLFNGRLLQHYPVTAQCWHAQIPHATTANSRYVAMEHEGKVPNDPTLTDAQVITARRVIAELSARYSWVPSRPQSASDTSYTLWEHGEVVRLGGTFSSCPSGRIPWDRILTPFEPIPEPPEEDEMIRFNAEALPSFWHGKVIETAQWMDARKDMGLPNEARIVNLDVWLDSGYLDVVDGDGTSFAGPVGGDASKRALVPVILNQDGYCLLRGQAKVKLIGMVGYIP